jgi:hypothetical protein
MFFSKRQKGQGLVEFALILPVLLLVVLGLIETALLFQAYLAIQHGAREAARFAVSMQPPVGHLIGEDGQVVECPAAGGADKWGIWCGGPDEGEAELDDRTVAWQRRRVQMIKARALESSMGVRVRDDKLLVGLDEQDYFDIEGHPELYGDYLGVPGFFGAQVRGFSRNEQGDLVQKNDHPSLPGLHVRVIIFHRAEVIDPLFSAIVDSVMLRARMDMINEGLQASGGPLPTFEPEPTPDLGPGPEPEPNDPPDTPVNEVPADDAIVDTPNPQFVWSDFNDPDGDLQSHFRVQLWPRGGDVSQDTGGFPGDASTFTPDDWDLPSDEYCWHVAVRDDRGAWSAYSEPTCFWAQGEDNEPPVTPVNEEPADGEIVDTPNPPFVWSDYSDPDGDPQSHLQIQLRTSSGGYGDADGSDTGPIASSASNYTPLWYPPLDDGEYYWRVRVRDDRGAWSDYSLETPFVVEAEPYLFVIGDHEEGDPFVLGEDVTVAIGKHDATTDYELWWVDPGGVANSFASVTTDDSGYAEQPWSLTDPPDPPDWKELIPGGVPGQVYSCTVQSRDPASGDVVAYQDISVLVPEDLPDLVVTGITFPDSPEANVAMTITVDVANLTYSTVEGFFDVNVYVDPERPPTQGRPGTSLQWVDGIGPLGTRTVTFVVTLVGIDDHEVWAYVDATNAVDYEGDEDNNRFGPESVVAGCGGYP